jgi:hypothetical protein
MAFIFTFEFAMEMLAAFVIFAIGYIALFVSLMICLAVIKGMYEGTKWSWAYASSFAASTPSLPLDDDKRAATAIH